MRHRRRPTCSRRLQTAESQPIRVVLPIRELVMELDRIFRRIVGRCEELGADTTARRSLLRKLMRWANQEFEDRIELRCVMYREVAENHVTALLQEPLPVRIFCHTL